MKNYEIFDGDNYLFTVMPSEDPYEVHSTEERNRHKPLRLIVIDDGKRNLVETDSILVFDEEESEEEYDSQLD